MNHELRIQRIYSPETPEDGYRILVDRLWPRGISKVRADLNEWDKQAAPDNAQRKLLHDHQESFEEFEKAYLDELDSNPVAAALAKEISEKLQTGNVTLLYASKDTDHNNAVVLKSWLEKQMEKNVDDQNEQSE